MPQQRQKMINLTSADHLHMYSWQVQQPCPTSQTMPDPVTIVDLRKGPHTAALPIFRIEMTTS